MNMREAMYYTLSRPVSTVIIGCDTIAQLEENVQLARDFTPLYADADRNAERDGGAGGEAVAVLPVYGPV